MPDPSKAVLVTGCSSGIGRATAERLATAGWTVYATARKPETLAELAAAGCRTLALDVTDEASMQAAVRAVEGPRAPSACWSTTPATASPARSRRCRWTRSAASSRPTCSGSCGSRSSCCRRCARSAGARSSTCPRWAAGSTFPGGGFYHATKYAVEAISDALRFEVRGFGIDVVLVEPGLIRTSFGEAAVTGDDERDRARSGPYADFNARVAQATAGAYERARSRASAVRRRPSRR